MPGLPVQVQVQVQVTAVPVAQLVSTRALPVAPYVHVAHVEVEVGVTQPPNESPLFARSAACAMGRHAASAPFGSSLPRVCG